MATKKNNCKYFILLKNYQPEMPGLGMCRQLSFAYTQQEMWLFKKILNIWAISSKSIFTVLLVICLIRNVENHMEKCYLLVFLILLHKYLQ